LILKTTQKSLYERLGRADGIVALVGDIEDKHMNNPVVKAGHLPFNDDPAYFLLLKRSDDQEVRI
jgi:hypothetical protein